jgi:hypothetical protein
MVDIEDLERVYLDALACATDAQEAWKRIRGADC